MSGDHTGVWSSVKDIVQHSAAIPAEYSGRPYGWNDMDMLETGNYDQAAHANGRESNMSAVEYKTEFSMWAISASPLVVTTPIMNCSAGWNAPTAPAGMANSSTDCQITLKKQASDAKCVLGESFGCSAGQHMWVDQGCRGTFLVDGSSVICDVDGAGRHYCGPVKCLPTITALQKEILLNTEVIAINQDVTPQGRPVVEGDLSVWARKLTGGDVAVALYNEADVAASIGFSLQSVGAASPAKVRDLWAHKDLGTVDTEFKNVTVAPHATMVLRVSAASVTALQAPSGTYTGTKSELGADVKATITIDDTSHADIDVEVTGITTISVKCPKEDYTLSGTSVNLPNQNKPGDCLHDHLQKDSASINSVTYDASSDSITISVHKILNIDVKLTK